jgi:hypothetical protein
MRPVRVFAGLLGLGIASAAAADTPFNHHADGEGDTILPRTSYPLGQSQVVASSMARSLRMEWVKRDLCWQIGCLVVHNDTKYYKVAEFRVQMPRRDGTARWGPNQLHHSLLPQQKIVRLKTAPSDSCERQLQFVMQNRQTREKMTIETVSNLCPTPHTDNVVRLNVVKPEVTIEE